MKLLDKKFLVGSKLLGLTNNKDIDYVVFDKKNESVFARCKEDYHLWTEEDLLDKYNFLFSANSTNKDLRMWLILYQFDYRIIKQNFPIHLDILKKRREVKNFLRFLVDNRLCNFNKYIKIERKYCSKTIYHFAYNLFILQNNSVYLTPEQKEVIQKIHDCQMPIEYLDELERMLNELD